MELKLKSLIMIVFISATIFMLLSIVEEWEVFQPFFLAKETKKEKLPLAVIKSIEFFNAMVSHYYSSIGDERFLDRIYASDLIKEDLFLDVEYLKENGIVQVMKIMSFKINDYKILEKDRFIVEVSEEWILHYEDFLGKRFSEKEATFFVNLRYYIQKKAEGYEIVKFEAINES